MGKKKFPTTWEGCACAVPDGTVQAQPSTGLCLRSSPSSLGAAWCSAAPAQFSQATGRTAQTQLCFGLCLVSWSQAPGSSSRSTPEAPWTGIWLRTGGLKTPSLHSVSWHLLYLPPAPAMATLVVVGSHLWVTLVGSHLLYIQPMWRKRHICMQIPFTIPIQALSNWVSASLLLRAYALLSRATPHYTRQRVTCDYSF